MTGLSSAGNDLPDSEIQAIFSSLQISAEQIAGTTQTDKIRNLVRGIVGGTVLTTPSQIQAILPRLQTAAISAGLSQDEITTLVNYVRQLPPHATFPAKYRSGEDRNRMSDRELFELLRTEPFPLSVARNLSGNLGNILRDKTDYQTQRIIHKLLFSQDTLTKKNVITYLNSLDVRAKQTLLQDMAIVSLLQLIAYDPNSREIEQLVMTRLRKHLTSNISQLKNVLTKEVVHPLQSRAQWLQEKINALQAEYGGAISPTWEQERLKVCEKITLLQRLLEQALPEQPSIPPSPAPAGAASTAAAFPAPTLTATPRVATPVAQTPQTATTPATTRISSGTPSSVTGSNTASEIKRERVERKGGAHAMADALIRSTIRQLTRGGASAEVAGARHRFKEEYRRHPDPWWRESMVQYLHNLIQGIGDEEVRKNAQREIVNFISTLPRS